MLNEPNSIEQTGPESPQQEESLLSSSTAESKGSVNADQGESETTNRRKEVQVSVHFLLNVVFEGNIFSR